jgi:hypothetical protein
MTSRDEEHNETPLADPTAAAAHPVTLEDAATEDVIVPSVDEIEIDDKMLSRVGRVQDAYASGEIDEKMIARAAKAVGISEDEARRRLAARVAPRPRPAGGNADRRKRSKQAKASRKRNRG